MAHIDVMAMKDEKIAKIREVGKSLENCQWWTRRDIDDFKKGTTAPVKNLSCTNPPDLAELSYARKDGRDLPDIMVGTLWPIWREGEGEMGVSGAGKVQRRA